MPEPTARNYYSALADFQRIRQQAVLKEILARLTGESIGLLSYEDVRKKLKAHPSPIKKLEEIPLDAIVGSVGRTTEFTRDFLPLHDDSKERWARIKAAMEDQKGLPPIEVYKVGEAYFVLDGNHRVSVARQLGSTTIQAYVTEVKTKVPLSPDVKPDDLIIKAEYADFLEQTKLDVQRPEADLSVTVPGQYAILLEHIRVHKYFMGIDQERDISDEEAVAHWYDTVYLPVVAIIFGHGILRDFPGRTETDLYLWITEHRAMIERELGRNITSQAAAKDLAESSSEKQEPAVSRFGGKILDTLIPAQLEAGPQPGYWRQMKGDVQKDTSLFADLLVPITGDEKGWSALDQAIQVAHKEGSRVIGLHVLPEGADENEQEALETKSKFEERCGQAGLPSQFIFSIGPVSQQICFRARFTDLVILNSAHPPSPRPISRLSSGLSNLIRSCPRPILAVPQSATAVNHPLLAYNGSLKSEEALFVSAYIASKWEVPLAILTVFEQAESGEYSLNRARTYLQDYGVEATYILSEGTDAATSILQTAQSESSDLIIMGGYNAMPVLEVVLGSTVDQILRESQIPSLICR